MGFFSKKVRFIWINCGVFWVFFRQIGVGSLETRSEFLSYYLCAVSQSSLIFETNYVLGLSRYKTDTNSIPWSRMLFAAFVVSHVDIDIRSLESIKVITFRAHFQIRVPGFWKWILYPAFPGITIRLLKIAPLISESSIYSYRCVQLLFAPLFALDRWSD